MLSMVYGKLVVIVGILVLAALCALPAWRDHQAVAQAHALSERLVRENKSEQARLARELEGYGTSSTTTTHNRDKKVSNNK